MFIQFTVIVFDLFCFCKIQTVLLAPAAAAPAPAPAPPPAAPAPAPVAPPVQGVRRAYTVGVNWQNLRQTLGEISIKKTGR